MQSYELKYTKTLLAAFTIWKLKFILDFFMAAVCNREGHMFVHPVVSSSFFSLPNLSGRRLDVYHTSIHGVALV